MPLPQLQAPEPGRQYLPARAKVLIVDDSLVARSVIGRMIDAMPRFAVVGAVATAAAALDFLADSAVDIILLDIEMPGVNGLTALPDLIAAGQGAKILIVSSACDDRGAAAVQALALGAADTLVKPGIGSFGGRFAGVLAERLNRLLDLPGDAGAAVARPVAPDPVKDFDIVAIGASTGGIHALSQLLRAIPPGFDVPILITQHLPSSFTPFFAAQIAVLAGRPCEVAHDRMRIRPGRVIVAPGTAHIRCVRTSEGAAVRLSDEPAASGCVPSVDPMLASIAEIYGDRALAVVLSGMGRDGSDGAAALARAGGTIIAQDRDSSVVWGMPGAVVAAGHAGMVLPPDRIGAFIAEGRRAR